MRRTALCAVLWTLTGVMWVKAFVVAALRVQGYHQPWWLAMFGEPVTVALIAAMSVILVVCHVLAPMGVVWKLAYRAGQHAVEQARPTRDNVVQLHQSPWNRN